MIKLLSVSVEAMTAVVQFNEVLYTIKAGGLLKLPSCIYKVMVITEDTVTLVEKQTI